MVGFPSISKRKKSEITLLLDIGTETVKALLFRADGSKINVLASSFEYFDRFGIFDSRDFEKDIMKRAILRTIQKIAGKNKSVVLSLPADILKARIIREDWKRPFPKKNINDAEEKGIYKKVLDLAKSQICSDFSQTAGILPADIEFVNLKILETKIDGYQVPAVRKYEGQNLSFRILATFLASHYLERIKKIIEPMGLKVQGVVHEAGGLSSYFAEKNDGIFIDIGGEITQIFRVKTGVLEEINEFAVGSQIFSKTISEKLGLTEAATRILKERYSKKELSKESSDRLEEILWPAWQTWLANLKLNLEQMAIGYLPSTNLTFFGGGSQLSDIKDVLKTAQKNKIFLGSGVEVRILDNAQEIPLLLMAHAWCYGMNL